MERSRIDRYLCIAGKLLTVVFMLSYAAILVSRFLVSLQEAIWLILCSAVCFLAISLLRRAFGALRPYQAEGAAPLRKGTNDSFPSRHAYSAFYVATLAFTVTPAMSYALLPLAVCLSFLRVACGLHFPRDVVAGSFLGVLLSILTIIIL